jgi:HK97 family phage major capsid protein
VVISQILPKAEANDQVCCLLGDLSMAAMLGDRRGTEIAFSQEASVGGQSMWERDELGIKGTERFDINVHDVGDSNATASAQNPGPIVGLLTAAS